MSLRRTRRLFFALLGGTALVATGAFWWQLPGLSGSHGIAPAAEYVARARGSGEVGFFDAPTLAWWWASDAALQVLCAACVGASLLLVFNRALRPALLVLWACWLSLVQVCHPWLDFQWDLLLLEAVFCAFWFAPGGWWLPREEVEPARAARFLMAWLACKVTLESGLVKLLGGDPSWRDLTALTYHWWTQPLPTWSSHLLNALPQWVQAALCAAMFVLELPVPLLALGPRRARLVAAAGLMLLQLALLGAGNYSYYNLLALVLAVPLLDDAVFWRAVPGVTLQLPSLRFRRLVTAVAALSVLVSVALFTRRWGVEPPAWVEAALERLAAFDTVNTYGAFAHMTKTRPEVLLEGTRDGVTWQRYELPYKPGALDRRPGFISPWQPRLDWQLWFAALGGCRANRWVLALQRHLLLGTPQVLALFAGNPFADAPPVAMRTRQFEYRFARWGEAGTWWTATETGPFCPAVTLDGGGELQLFDDAAGRR